MFKNSSAINQSIPLHPNSVKRSLDSLLSVNKVEKLSKDNENSDDYKNLPNVLFNNISNETDKEETNSVCCQIFFWVYKYHLNLFTFLASTDIVYWYSQSCPT